MTADPRGADLGSADHRLARFEAEVHAAARGGVVELEPDPAVGSAAAPDLVGPPGVQGHPREAEHGAIDADADASRGAGVVDGDVGRVGYAGPRSP